MAAKKSPSSTMLISVARMGWYQVLRSNQGSLAALRRCVLLRDGGPAAKKGRRRGRPCPSSPLVLPIRRCDARHSSLDDFRIQKGGANWGDNGGLFHIRCIREGPRGPGNLSCAGGDVDRALWRPLCGARRLHLAGGGDPEGRTES